MSITNAQVTAILNYAALYGYSSTRYWQFTFNGNFSTGDATEYATLLNWTDTVYEKLPWAYTIGDPALVAQALNWAATDYAGINFPAAETKLAGIATGATANDTDANLKNRANHTGTQTASTISDFTTSARSSFSAGSNINISGGVISNTAAAPKSYEGTTLRSGAFPIFKTGTVSSGTAVFHLTDDGLSTGNALFANGVIQDSVNLTVNDATASYQMSWAFSNGNKTLTITANKLTTANILTGILGQGQANSAVIKLQIWGY